MELSQKELGKRQFDRAWRKGRALRWEEAIELARI
jgi:hypothetical protein